MESQTKTFGEERVNLSFNPSENELVTKVKKLYAEILDTLFLVQVPEGVESGEKVRLLKIAMTEAEGAALWAVKAITK